MCRLVLLALACASVFGSLIRNRGVDPALISRYSGASFLCDNGRELPMSVVNDDYCDCWDGTDEPGTAACWNGRFYCSNIGSQPEFLTASKVDDGVCDCCDGSDELRLKCENTCLVHAQNRLLELKENARRFEEAMYSKQQRQKQALREVAERAEELREVRESLAALLAAQKDSEQQENDVELSENADKIENEKDAEKADSGVAKNVFGKVGKWVNKWADQKEKKQVSTGDRFESEKAKLEAREKQLVALDFDAADVAENSIWRTFLNKCLESPESSRFKYVVCLLGKATQKDGRHSVHVGNFHSASETELNWTNGAKCPGKSRSLKLRLACDPQTEMELSEITEPVMCEYQGDLRTVFACSEAELAPLLQQIEQIEQVLI
ncbi:MAG: hypothetical protein MHM6MM_002706 [Cercozoa sp. M6MM]